MTRKDPQPAPRTAEIAEFGPFAGADKIAGVTHDGHNVWAATGGALVAFDPDSGEPTQAGRGLRRRHGLRRHLPVPDRRVAHRQDRSRHRRRAGVDPAPGGGSDSGLTWAEGSLWVGQYRDRRIHQIDLGHRRDPPHHRVQPLRHRRHLVDGELWHGTWKATRASCAASTWRTAPYSIGWPCRQHVRERTGVRWRRPVLLRRRQQRQGPRGAAAESRSNPERKA